MAVQITSAGTNELLGMRQVIRTSTGNIYVVFEDGGKVEVWYSADGTAWAQKDAAHSPDCMADSPVSCAVDGNDILHIVYYDDQYPASGGLNYITFDTIDGGAKDDAFNTEEEAMDQEDAANTTFSCGIAIDSNNKPHVVFTDSDAVKGVNHDTIYYSNKVGVNWKALIEVWGVSQSANAGYADIYIDKDDKPVITHVVNVNSDGGFGGRASQGDVNDAASFADSGNLFGFYTWRVKSLGAGVDSDGNHYIIGMDTNGNDLKRRIHNYGDAWNTWQAATIIDSSPPTPFGMVLSLAIVTGNDNYLIFADTSDDIVYYTDASGSWVGPTTLEDGTYKNLKAKWSYLYDNQSATQIDYIFGDSPSGDVYWNKIVLVTPPTPSPILPRPPGVKLRGPLFSLTARGWLGGYSYRHRYVCRNPYPIGLLPKIFAGYRMPAFSLHPYPQFISQYYSTSGWIYQRRRTWHGIIWVAFAGYLVHRDATPSRIRCRNKFADAVAAWHGLTGLEKGVWNSYNHPRRASGYNRFISAYMKDKPH